MPIISFNEKDGISLPDFSKEEITILQIFTLTKKHKL